MHARSSSVINSSSVTNSDSSSATDTDASTQQAGAVVVRAEKVPVLCLTREASQIKTMLTRYADAVLHELQKIDKEKALRKKLEGGKRLNA